MKIKVALAAALVVASTGGALARAKNIVFNGFCDGLQIRVDRATKVLAAALPTGCLINRGVAVGTIGRSTIAELAGKWLILTRNENGTDNRVLMYALQYPLVNGGLWATFGTIDGRTVEAGGFGTYSLGVAPSGAAHAKPSTSTLPQD